MGTAELAPEATLDQMALGHRVTHLLYVAAELGLADHLGDGPRGADELAALVGAHAGALERVLTGLAHLGIVVPCDDGRFALSPLGAALRSDAPRSFRPVARLYGHDLFQRPWANLLHTVMTGETAFDHVFGMSLFEYLMAHPDAAAIFNDGMLGQTAQVTAAVLGGYDFSRRTTIVDVGGGAGALIAAILTAHPTATGTILDLPHAGPGAQQTIEAAGLAGRCQFAAGDFFTAVPARADAYLLKFILHDWDDERSVAILQACRRAMTPASVLLIIERVLPDGTEPALRTVMADLAMLALTGGRERRATEYQALLERAGLRLVRVISLPGEWSIVEGVPA